MEMAGEAAQGFLGVSQSFTGRRWIGPDPARDRAAEALAQATGLGTALCHVLAQREIPASEAAAYLDPKLRDLLPDPRGLKDMDAAAARIVAALAAGERIAVFADYDVDGGSSAALLIRFARALGHGLTLYVPDRIDEGYGPNAPAMSHLAASHDLIICVDCGTLSHDALAAAQGADVIVLDHHLGGETLPPALAVVNPNRADESGDLGHLCAAGVVFLALVEVNRLRRSAGLPCPDLMALLDLVALATVADVAPLIGVNRAFVRSGLTVLHRRANAGLVALADVAGLDQPPGSRHLGFVLGPRINAGGRIGQADLGARLLSCDDPDQAAQMAQALEQENTRRREIESQVREATMAQAEARGTDGALVWAAAEGWHPGVVGIVAARMVEATGRPAVVIGFEGDQGKGSGRSVSGVDLGAAVQRLAHDGDITKGGGHRMAAGLSLTKDQLEPAMERLETLLAAQGAGSGGPRALRLDGVVMPSAMTAELIDQLEQAGPYGQSAPMPRFALPRVMVYSARQIGKGHLKLSFGDAGGPRREAIAFGAYDSDLGPAVEAHIGQPLNLAGTLELNHWNGRSTVQLRLDDAAAIKV
ncbi:MAG: single-stranded-DNA-specific exonuclease RecJ [Mangrovicoccus sp.]|nr:single-stranded-DNA-specific exonuclease RecJ [Mangrovicoccus sp.]